MIKTARDKFIKNGFEYREDKERIVLLIDNEPLYTILKNDYTIFIKHLFTPEENPDYTHVIENDDFELLYELISELKGENKE